MMSARNRKQIMKPDVTQKSNSARDCASPVDSSSLIPHPSSLIPHPSSLIPHSSSLIPHPSSLIPHHSSFPDVDLSFVDRTVEDLGRGREVVIPILQAIQEHYRYLPQEALERV